MMCFIRWVCDQYLRVSGLVPDLDVRYIYIEMEHYINSIFCRKEFEGALLQHHLVFGSTYDIKLLPKHTVTHHKCCHNSHNFVQKEG